MKYSCNGMHKQPVAPFRLSKIWNYICTALKSLTLTVAPSVYSFCMKKRFPWPLYLILLTYELTKLVLVSVVCLRIIATILLWRRKSDSYMLFMKDGKWTDTKPLTYNKISF